MKSKFILITAILLSLLEQGFSQRENIQAIINMPAECKRVFNEGQKMMSDLRESEALKIVRGKLIIYRRQLTEKKWNWFSISKFEQTEATEKKLQRCS